jgi:predicted nucleic acid-binding protein
VTAFDYFFPDNTVLINFAIIEQMPLLRGLLLEKGTWVAAVAAECEQSARTGLYPLALGTAGAIMTETLVPTRTEMADARTIRNDIASANEPFPKSYGEAQTLAIITRRNLSAIVITDDGGVGRYVKENSLDIRVISTTDLLALAVRSNRISRLVGEAHIAKLVVAKRRRISMNRFHASLGPQQTAP